jgi:hypothetical protein
MSSQRGENGCHFGLSWFNLVSGPKACQPVWRNIMTARTTTTKSRRRANRSGSVVTTKKAKAIKGSLKAAHAITKRLEELRKVDLEALSQPMTL